MSFGKRDYIINLHLCTRFQLSCSNSISPLPKKLLKFAENIPNFEKVFNHSLISIRNNFLKIVKIQIQTDISIHIDNIHITPIVNLTLNLCWPQ